MAVTTTNLGVITAYGDAVAAGYTGTKAEWQALMASYATVGQQAVNAKNDAVAAKNTAVDKATEATTAANTATTKAGEASASAQSIAQSAAQIQENTDDIDELKEELAVTSSYNITWSQGGINSSGTAVSRTNRIRTDYITIENDSIFVEIPSGFKYAIHAYNSSKTRIGYIPNGSDIMTDRKATYKVSDSYDNAVYFRIWVAYTDDSDILPAEGANVTVAPFESVIASLKSHVLKSVRILGVGNSYTRDSIRWLCKILKESGYEDVVVGHGYLGASTLAEQYASLDSSDSNHSAFEYWKYNNTKNATKTSGKTLDEIFADEPWDIVVFQQQSDESGQYASYDSLSFDINDFITYISGKVSNANLKFALMMPWSHAAGYTSTKFAEYYNSDPKAMLDAIKTVIPQVADHMSQCDYVVNAGEAIDLGRQNSYLNALGDQMLRTDKNHLYYGIPSYMVGLVYAVALCDVNLNNVMWYPTETDEGQTGITTSGYLAYLAKQCAEAAQITTNATAIGTLSNLTTDTKTNLVSAINEVDAHADANAGEISQLKNTLTDKADTTDMLKAFPTDTASGSVASFTDGANVPVKSLIVNIDPVQEGSGDPSPTNVRPISGWSDVNVQRTGKNLWGGEKLADDIVAKVQSATKDTTNKTVTYSSAWVSAKVLFDNFKENTQYTFYMSTESPFTNLRVWYSDETNATIMPNTIFVSQSGKTVDRLAGVYSSGSTALKYEECGIFEGVITEQDFEPYIGQSINISLGQTVYGGTLDVTKGKLVIDRAMADLGTLNWTYKDSSGIFYTNPAISNIKYVSASLIANIKCSQYVTVKASGPNNGIDKSISVGHLYISNGVNIMDSAYTDAITFKTAMNGAQLVYELATPLTIQLGPHEVTALLGSNNVWADTGDSTVEYRADPTLYISRLTEPDADMIADANITSGQYFMVGNSLYKATANIASGGAITPNVNCTRKSLSEALNELNA